MENRILHTDQINWELKNGILIAAYKKGPAINLLSAKIQVSNRKEFTKGKKYPILIKDYGVAVIEKDARSYLTSKEGTEGISAAAMVLTNVFSTFLGNYLVKLNPIEMPVKIFKHENEAVAWLQQYKTKE